MQVVAADQNFCRELQARCKSPDHLERERAHAVEHFRDPRAGDDVPFQVLARQAARFHHVEQKVDRVGRLDRGVLALVVTARRVGRSCTRAGALKAINANTALDTGLNMAMRGAARSRPRFTRSRGSCGLFDALPDLSGGIAGGTCE